MLAVTLCLAVLLGPADLDDLARRYDLAWSVDPGTGRHTVRAGRLTVVFAPGVQAALVNGTITRLSAPVTVENGRVRLPADLARIVESNVASAAAARPATPKVRPETAPPPARRLPPCTIVIDPGHGGVHTGFVGRGGLMEKDINLDVSLEMRRLLESWGATVVMTRTDDRHFDPQANDDLDERVRIVNAARADLFVSVHTNGVTGNSRARGFEVWVPLGEGARQQQSREMAREVLGELGGVWSSENRGIKDEHNLRVLKGTRCPAVLVELEFVSNPSAERQLAARDVRMRLAASVAEAVRKWVVRRK